MASSYDKLVASVIRSQREQRAAMQTHERAAKSGGGRVDWSKVDEPRAAVAREHHVSGGMFKSPAESHHHPDSQMREGDWKTLRKESLSPEHRAQQSGPRGGRYVLLPGGGKRYL